MPSIKRLYGTFGPCGDFNLELQCEKLQPHSKNVDLNDERDLLLAISMGILFKLCLHGMGTILFWITYPMVHYPKEIDILRSNDFS